jgi:hypothetical protein
MIMESFTGIPELLCLCIDRMLTVVTFRFLRDLHPKNVLAAKKYYPTGRPEDSMEFDIQISDFGEGKRIGGGKQDLTSASGSLVCAIGDYMPKEVSEEGGWSTKTDVFCFGRIAQMMLSTRGIMCTAEGSDDERAIPTTLKEVLKNCLAEDAAERPHMASVRQALADLSWQIEDGEAEWTTIDIHDNLPATKNSTFSTLTFSS